MMTEDYEDPCSLSTRHKLYAYILNAHRSGCLMGVCICFFIAIITVGSVLAIVLTDSASCSDYDPNSISASVSLAKSDGYYNNDTLPPSSSSSSSIFAFHVHIDLQPYWATEYRNTTVFLRRDGTDIDEYPIPGADAWYGEPRRIDVLLRLNGSDPAVVSAGGGGGGSVRLQVRVRFSPVNSRFDKHPVAEASCELALDLESRMLAYNECNGSVWCE